MATRFIHRGVAAPDAVGTANGFGFDQNDTLQVKRVQDGAQATSWVPLDRVVKKTASFTVTAADHGTTFVFDSTTSVVATLPATVQGLRFRFLVEQLTTSGGHAVSPAAADQILGNGFTAADDKDAICSAASDAVGDWLEVTGDGELGWYITSIKGTWARE